MTRSMFMFFFIALVATGRLLAVPQGSSAEPPLTAAQIQEAIDWGTGTTNPKKRPEPYPIGGYKTGGVFGMGSVLVDQRGFLLTPYLKVALLAREAKETYKTFGPNDVAPEMLSPLIDVIALPYKRSSSTSPVDRYVDVEAVLIMPAGSKDPSQAIRPVAVEPNVSHLQNAFGLKIETTGLIARFNRSDLKPNSEFVFVFKSALWPGSDRRELREKISAKDLIAWK